MIASEREDSARPNETQLPTPDGDVTVFEWPGGEPTIFLAHATGFHARCWDEVIRLLPEFRCVALDAIGHGRSASPPGAEPYDWERLANGASAAIETMNIRNGIGVGHSMGGYLVTRAAAALPGAFAGLLLVDPSILSEASYGQFVRDSSAASFVMRRRNIWQSPDEMIERFTGRPPFGHWKPDVLADYCRYGLILNEEGSYRLACLPEVEAAVYAATAGSSPYADIRSLEIPVRILRARQRPAEITADMSFSPTAPDLALQFRHGEDVLLPDHTHYIPMEDPDLVASHIRAVASTTRPH